MTFLEWLGKKLGWFVPFWHNKTDVAKGEIERLRREFCGVELHSGITVNEIRAVGPLIDLLGRPATGHAIRVGSKITIEISQSISIEEIFITFYHEIIEGALAVNFRKHVPLAMQELNEEGIDELAQRYAVKLGSPTVALVNQMLEELGFE